MKREMKAKKNCVGRDKKMKTDKHISQSAKPSYSSPAKYQWTLEDIIIG